MEMNLEVFAELNLARDSRLVCGDAALEEVRELLHILKLHEAEGILCIEVSTDTEALKTRISHVTKILTHIAYRKTGYTATEKIFSKLRFGVDRFFHHDDDLALQLRVPKIRLLRTHNLHDFEGELKMRALVTEDPVGARSKAMQEALGTEEVDISKRREEEETFDASSKADEVEKELAAMLLRLQCLQLLNAVHPLHAEVSLLGDGRDVLYCSEGGITLFRLWNVVIQKREVELHMHGLFKQLPREVKTRLGRVDVLVKVEHEIVRNDRVSGCEEGNEALDGVDLGWCETLLQIDEVCLEVDFFDGPCVLDAVAAHVIELRIAHGAQCETQAWIENRNGRSDGRVQSF